MSRNMNEAIFYDILPVMTLKSQLSLKKKKKFLQLVNSEICFEGANFFCLSKSIITLNIVILAPLCSISFLFSIPFLLSLFLLKIIHYNTNQLRAIFNCIKTNNNLYSNINKLSIITILKQKITRFFNYYEGKSIKSSFKSKFCFYIKPIEVLELI